MQERICVGYVGFVLTVIIAYKVKEKTMFFLDVV